MYKKIIVTLLVVLVGVPTVAAGSSLSTSFMQGKSPSEALSILIEQIDTLSTKIGLLEARQENVVADIELLQLENEELRKQLDQKADVVVPPTETPACLALKERIREVEEEFEVPTNLTQQYNALRQELRDAKLGEIGALQDTSRTDEDGDDIADWQERLDTANKEVERIEVQIEAVEVQIDEYQERKQEAKRPLIDEGSQTGCLLG